MLQTSAHTVHILCFLWLNHKMCAFIIRYVGTSSQMHICMSTTTTDLQKNFCKNLLQNAHTPPETQRNVQRHAGKNKEESAWAFQGEAWLRSVWGVSFNITMFLNGKGLYYLVYKATGENICDSQWIEIVFSSSYSQINNSVRPGMHSLKRSFGKIVVIKQQLKC